MSVYVMLSGGRRDGEILEVRGTDRPASFRIRIPVLLPPEVNPPSDYASKEIETSVILLEIVPRHMEFGPLWKIDLPKELW